MRTTVVAGTQCGCRDRTVSWQHEGVTEQPVERRNLTMRHMAGAMGALALCLLAILGLMGWFTFGNSTDDGKAPVVDVIAKLSSSADIVGLPLVVPQGLPATWQGTSFQAVYPTVSGGSRTVVRAGWLTESGRYITLVQSGEVPRDLVTNEIGEGLGGGNQVEAGGATWDTYPGLRSEQVWVRRSGELTLLITGSASEDDFRLLAQALPS